MMYSIVLQGGIINEFLDNIQSRIGNFFTGWFDFFLSPLWLWYGIGLGVFAAVCLIAFFLPFKWVRAALGGILIIGGAFLAGGTTMHKTMKAKLDEERRKRKEAEKLVRQNRPTRTGWFG